MNLEKIRFCLALFLGRLVYFFMKTLGLDATTFPGKVALKIDPKFLTKIKDRFNRIILVTGTNGKTTTNNLIFQIVTKSGFKALGNLEGANLRTGIATAFIRDPSYYDFGVFEVDEGIFPFVFKDLKPDYVVITNFFRDQLDRYGEIDTTVEKIKGSIKDSRKQILILNADDPFVSRFSDLSNRKIYYGIGKKIREKDTEEIKESIYCPKCGKRLHYEFFNYAQLGRYFCECGFRNPGYDYYILSAEYKENKWFIHIKDGDEDLFLTFIYPGVYNLYNVVSAYSVGRVLGIDKESLKDIISNFSFRLGRLEKFNYKGYERILVLVKNPAGYNQVLDTIKDDPNEKVLLLILNDNIADGRDVSWIWDVDFEKIRDDNISAIICSGTRAEDLLVRLKYAEVPLNKIVLENNLNNAILKILSFKAKTYILPTYTALFKSRKLIMKRLRNGT
jgi:UDP-N-acetylmuramyl tripeptide synthase